MRSILIGLLLGAASLSLSPAWAQSGYELVANPQPTSTGDKVEVIEFFWYGCPHCYRFLPHIEEWSRNPPPNAAFRLEAPPLNPSWTLHSRAFYSARLLGVLDKFHVPMFNALHRDRKKMKSISEIVEFVGSLGIDEKKFEEAMTSFAVETAVRKSNQLARAYRLGGVPAVTVAGKYLTNGSIAGGYPQLIQVLDQLVAQESANK